MEQTTKDLIVAELYKQMGVAAFMMLTRNYDRSTLREIISNWSDTLASSLLEGNPDMEYLISCSVLEAVEDVMAELDKYRNNLNGGNR